jgi:hypothetical protein
LLEGGTLEEFGFAQFDGWFGQGFDFTVRLRRYPDAQEAVMALSGACVRHGRTVAKLAPLPRR